MGLSSSPLNDNSKKLESVTNIELKKEVLNKCQELKVVIHSKEDLIFAEEMNKIIDDSKKKANHKQLNKPFLFLQPGWKSPEGNKLAIEHVLHHPNWRLSMQTHKWLGLL